MNKAPISNLQRSGTPILWPQGPGPTRTGGARRAKHFPIIKSRSAVFSGALFVLLAFASCSHHHKPETVAPKQTAVEKPVEKRTGKLAMDKALRAEMAQVPTWTRGDLDFFLHGSMSTEVVPEKVLRAFMKIYPDLFPSADLSHLGLLPDPAFGWPIGFSRTNVPHLGGLSALGVNCAACHVGDVLPQGGGAPSRILGMTSMFDSEAYFGAVAISTFRTEEPENMKKFLAACLGLSRPGAEESAQKWFDEEWSKQEQAVKVSIAADPSGGNSVPPGELVELKAEELDFGEGLAGKDLPARAYAILRLFHNMRASLHIPDIPPEKPPPLSGPGRNDAFGLLSLVLFNETQPYAPVKYGLVWNVDRRTWVHWDGNTRSPLGRNLLASLGLGAPLIGKRGYLDFDLVKRQTDLSETIRAPRYPFAIDQGAARRGEYTYQTQCRSCHGFEEGDGRLYPPGLIGTEPTRAEHFTYRQADNFNKFLAELEIPGYKPPAQPGIRSTQRYWAATLNGVWARSPYLHNGSVRTMKELLTPPADRAKSFHRGSRQYDAENMGYIDGGPYLLDTSSPGSANTGHSYGAGLSERDKKDLIEYLKTR